MPICGALGWGVVLLHGVVLWGCGRSRQDAGPPGTTSPPDRTAASESALAAEVRRSASKTEASRRSAFAERSTERLALSELLAEQGIEDTAVLRAIGRVPRHAFVLPEFERAAYVDRALPIVGGQTISQPFVVAFMTALAAPNPGSRCLEIGTGSGYQGAILAEICKHTYCIEYLPEVARFGEDNLRRLGYGPDRISLRVGDGYAGWPEAAPFEAVLVTAAPERVPEPLLAQVAVGGRLVIPVGPSEQTQELQRWTRLRPGSGDDAFKKETLLPVRFVPFAGERVAR